MGNPCAVRVAFVAFFTLASLTPRALAQANTWKGRFLRHTVREAKAGGTTFTDYTTVKVDRQISIQQSSGTYTGSLKIDFPDTALTGHIEGNFFVLDQEITTHVALNLTWTPPASATDDFAAYTLAYGFVDDSIPIANLPCRFQGPLQAPLKGKTPYPFAASLDCTWKKLQLFGALPSSALAGIVFDLSLTCFGDKANPFIVDVDEYVDSLFEFTNPTADFTVDHIEVVQAVQDAPNTVPLVAGKTTVARVFVNYDDTDASKSSATVTGTLRAQKGSASLGPLTPFNPGGVMTVPRRKGGTLEDRNRTEGSLNFLLPESWIAEGTLIFEAAVNTDSRIAESNTANNTAAQTLTFRPSPVFLVNFIPICHPDLLSCPSNTVSAFDGMARKLYPVAESKFAYKPLKAPRWLWPYELNTEADATPLIAYLRRRYALLDRQEGALPDQLAAWLPDIGTQTPLGYSDPIWLGSTGRVSFQQDTSGRDAPGTSADFSDAAFTLAHEVGHNLGLRHVDRLGLGEGCKSGDLLTDFPYSDARIHEAGFDTVHKAAVPSTKKDLMSYCSPPASNIWISDFDYKKLYAGGLKPRQLRPLAASDYAIVTGFAARDGKTGQIASVDRLTAFAGADASNPTGNHCLQFSTASGSVLASHCFDLTFEGQKLDHTEVELSKESFAIKAPLPAGAAKISLMTGASQLASVSRSPNAPVVAITSPSAGSTWSGVNTITWTASDADGDPLSFVVLTSPDNGSSWLPMETDLAVTRFTFDTAELAAGSKTLFKVVASDGFNAAAATVGPLTITPQSYLEATPILDFGTLAPGQSLTLPVLLTNRGDAAVRVTSASLTGAGFTTAAAVPFTIAAGGSQKIDVLFKPATTGRKSARLTIGSDDTGRPSLAVALSGTACVSSGNRPCSGRTPRTLPSR